MCYICSQDKLLDEVEIDYEVAVCFDCVAKHELLHPLHLYDDIAQEYGLEILSIKCLIDFARVYDLLEPEPEEMEEFINNWKGNLDGNR